MPKESMHKFRKMRCLNRLQHFWLQAGNTIFKQFHTTETWYSKNDVTKLQLPSYKAVLLEGYFFYCEGIFENVIIYPQHGIYFYNLSTSMVRYISSPGRSSTLLQATDKALHHLCNKILKGKSK